MCWIFLIGNYANEYRTLWTISRIPIKIETGFSGFTADQFKNWPIPLSVIPLSVLLPMMILNAGALACLTTHNYKTRGTPSSVLQESTANVWWLHQIRTCTATWKVYSWIMGQCLLSGPTSNHCIETRHVFCRTIFHKHLVIKQNLRPVASPWPTLSYATIPISNKLWKIMYGHLILLRWIYSVTYMEWKLLHRSNSLVKSTIFWRWHIGCNFSSGFASVSWYEIHPQRFLLGKPVQLWHNDHSFLSLELCVLSIQCEETGENLLAMCFIMCDNVWRRSV